MLNIESCEYGLFTKDATSCETSSIFYCPKVNNTRHNKYNSSPVEGYVMYKLLLVIINYTSQRVNYIIISSTGELVLLSVKMMKKRQLLKHLNGILVIKYLALLAVIAIIIII